jgi:hypothetical protein
MPVAPSFEYEKNGKEIKNKIKINLHLYIFSSLIVSL